jgi:hypothetical protein
MSIELKIEDHLGLPVGSWEILALHTDLVWIELGRSVCRKRARDVERWWLILSQVCDITLPGTERKNRSTCSRNYANGSKDVFANCWPPNEARKHP